MFIHNFDKCWPISKILSLLDSAVNLPRDLRYISNHTCNVSLHYVVEYIISKKQQNSNVFNAISLFALLLTKLTNVCVFMSHIKC